MRVRRGEKRREGAGRRGKGRKGIGCKIEWEKEMKTEDKGDEK